MEFLAAKRLKRFRFALTTSLVMAVNGLSAGPSYAQDAQFGVWTVQGGGVREASIRSLASDGSVSILVGCPINTNPLANLNPVLDALSTKRSILVLTSPSVRAEAGVSEDRKILTLDIDGNRSGVSGPHNRTDQGINVYRLVLSRLDHRGPRPEGYLYPPISEGELIDAMRAGATLRVVGATGNISLSGFTRALAHLDERYCQKP